MIETVIFYGGPNDKLIVDLKRTPAFIPIEDDDTFGTYRLKRDELNGTFYQWQRPPGNWKGDKKRKIENTFES